MQKASKIYELFLSVTPGLEVFAKEEIKDLLSSVFFSEVELDLEDGLTLKSSDLFVLLTIIKFLKIPTRVLLRIEEFKARDLPKLYKKLTKINWNDYIPTTEIEFKVSSHNSRLFDDRKIIKATKDAISDYQKAQPFKAKYSQLEWSHPPIIFLRFEEDMCQLSIDCSGERLDKRGHKILSAKAPMRESLGAALIRFINENEDSDYPLLDPMAGSGTIVSEYLLQDELNNKRAYNFENFPIFRKLPAKKIEMAPIEIARKAFANDINQDNIKAIKKNLEQYNLEVTHGDFFKMKELNHDNIIIACNLPYGKRIKTQKNIHDFVNDFFSKAQQIGAKSAYAVIPETFIIDKKFKILRSQRINNGGIWIQFVRASFI
ncbi:MULTISPECIES: THUMP domain-containing protein [unclassified Halobacteriovorax]|uniref:THUMP domain-containing protein n=1 Tax=unclassified Halobacteriovorax TaxID=2639665 RepID=UPI00399ACFD5